MDNIYIRQTKYYNPLKDNERVFIVGCGSLGGNIAIALAKMGLNDFKLFDPDKVEPHNIPNQPFDMTQIGQEKTLAVAEMIKKQHQGNCSVQTFSAFVPGLMIDPQSVVFNVSDSLLVRENVFNAATSSTLIIDARTGPSSFNVYTCNPMDKRSVDFYKKTFIVDEDTGAPVGGGCGAQSTVFGNLAVTSIAVNLWMRFQKGEAIPSQINGDLLTLETEQIYF